jgi:hypothetical protein
VIWSRVKNALTWTDLRSVVNPVQGKLPDGRLRYDGYNVASGTNTDVLLTNTDKGYSWNIAVGFDKSWQNGISIGGAYTWQRVKDLNPGTSSVAFSNYDNTVGSLDPNNSAYGTSNYQIDNAWRLRFGYDTQLFGDNTSRVELFFNSRAGQHYSHTFADLGTAGRSAVFGVTGNDGRQLMYVPVVASIDADPLVSYDSPATFAALQEYIRNGALEGYQGRIAPKNLGKSPRFNKLDLRISQEVPFVLGGKIELFGDVENLLNLIDSDWGSLRQVAFPYRAQIVNVQCLQANGSAVTGPGQACAKYRYSGFRNPSLTNYTNISIWQIRLGVRLQFRGLRSQASERKRGGAFGCRPVSFVPKIADRQIRRSQISLSDSKSSVQSSFGPCGWAIGTHVPNLRLRPARRRVPTPSSRCMRAASSRNPASCRQSARGAAARAFPSSCWSRPPFSRAADLALRRPGPAPIPESRPGERGGLHDGRKTTTIDRFFEGFQMEKVK